MSNDLIRLELAPSPHIKAPDTTPRIMWTVVATLVPILAASLYFFGLGALLVVAASTLGAVLTEFMAHPPARQSWSFFVSL